MKPGTTSRLLLALLSMMAGSTAFAERPNVLFIMVDDLNDYVSLLQDYPGIRTPNLDRFSKSAMVFTRGYCAGVACGPSRAAMLSGVPPHLTGSYENGQPALFPPGTVMLTEHFQANGYTTMGAGKIFHGGGGRGWDKYAGARGLGPKPMTPGLPVEWDLPPLFDYGAWTGKDTDFPDVVNRDVIINWLSQEHDKPFFIAYGLYRPHNPWTAPGRFFDMHPLDRLTMPRDPAPDMADLPPAAIRMAHTVDKKYRKEPVRTLLNSHYWKRVVQSYLASISFMDDNLGQVLDALDKSPHVKDTIVFLAADHGFHMGEKEHFAKFGLWEQTTRILYAYRVPGMTPQEGSLCSRTVSLMDVYPTLVDLCGLPRPHLADRMSGRSLRPLLENRKAQWDRPVLSTYGFKNHAVRDERWRYIRYENGDEELYDHEKDFHEWNNLAMNSKYETIKAQLARYLPKVNVPAREKPKQKKNK